MSKSIISIKGLRHSDRGLITITGGTIRGQQEGLQYSRVSNRCWRSIIGFKVQVQFDDQNSSLTFKVMSSSPTYLPSIGNLVAEYY